MNRVRALAVATVFSWLSALAGGCSGNNSSSLTSRNLPVADGEVRDEDAGEEAPSDAAGQDPDDGDAASGEEDDSGVVIVEDPRCGDGQLDEGEVCDDGDANSDGEPDACRVNCQRARCGDTVIDTGEACDDGSLNSDVEPDACREDCTRPRCGDATVDDGEQCDTGDRRSDSAPGACRLDCRASRCGDGVTDPDEACDDRNRDEQDGCLDNCRSASCGDGARGPGEECDDGNTRDGDGCQSTCRRPICGDRVVDAGEQCDDGNQSNNDGCRATCRAGCVAARACDDGVFCNGAERCVDGVCQAGPAPGLDDRVSCTVDACDEAANAVTHAADDALCSIQPTSCSGGVRVSHDASCAAATGCEGSTMRSGCPDARATCTPRTDGSIELATFTPACDPGGTDCGAPAVARELCAARAPTCDTGARVGTVYAATCDAAAESCGSEVAQTNDCSALDAVRCGRANLSEERAVGQCDARGQCAAATTIRTCPDAAPTCSSTAGAGSAVYHIGTCSLPGGCTTREDPRECRTPDVRSCSGSTLQVQQARCKPGRGCTMDVETTQPCDPPTCRTVAGAAAQICGGCGTDPNGAVVCLACRTCPAGQVCSGAAGAAACRPQVIRLDGGIIAVPIGDAGVINPDIILQP